MRMRRTVSFGLKKGNYYVVFMYSDTSSTLDLSFNMRNTSTPCFYNTVLQPVQKNSPGHKKHIKHS